MSSSTTRIIPWRLNASSRATERRRQHGIKEKPTCTVTVSGLYGNTCLSDWSNVSLLRPTATKPIAKCQDPGVQFRTSMKLSILYQIRVMLGQGIEELLAVSVSIRSRATLGYPSLKFSERRQALTMTAFTGDIAVGTIRHNTPNPYYIFLPLLSLRRIMLQQLKRQTMTREMSATMVHATCTTQCPRLAAEGTLTWGGSRTGRPAKDDGGIFGGALGIVGDLLEEGMVARISGYCSSPREEFKEITLIAPGTVGSCEAAANGMLSVGTAGNVKGGGTKD
ncbi:hypothetical protein EDB19DRAFT_1831018 [Suillus lakei]|nr:hypothetical protein EDB19DRAFT_1831018 [Suillus lakei]